MKIRTRIRSEKDHEIELIQAVIFRKTKNNVPFASWVSKFLY